MPFLVPSGTSGAIAAGGGRRGSVMPPYLWELLYGRQVIVSAGHVGSLHQGLGVVGDLVEACHMLGIAERMRGQWQRLTGL